MSQARAQARVDPTDLASALVGVRGLLLDLDGVVILAGRAIDGASEALAILDQREIPYRIVTNTSLMSRMSMSAWAARAGFSLAPERILSALSLSAAYTRRRHPGRPIFVMASEDARTEFAGQHLLSDEEAGRPGATASAVVIGDSPESATYDNLNHAFRLVRAGAELIGMHRNPWWLTPDGPSLDSGAFVAGLEFASGRRATVIGKPSAAFFREAAAELIAELPGASRHDLAMVGDDVFSDVLAAQRLGLRGVFVRTGKHGDAELAAAGSRRRGGGVPDAVAPSLAGVVSALVDAPR